MYICLLAIGLVFIPAALSQISLSNCNRAWQQQYRCLAQNVDRSDRNDPTWPVPDNGGQNRIRTDVDRCFKQAGCRQSPFPSNQEMNARRQCFQDSKRDLDRDLDTCVRDSNKLRDWNNPIDQWPQQDMDEWAYIVKRVADAQNNPRDICDQSVRSNDMRNCVRDKTTFNFNQAPFGRNNPPSYWCESDAQCWYDVGPTCQKMWEDRVVPVLCECSKRMKSQNRLRQAQDSYAQCMSRRLRQDNNYISRDDPGPSWLDEYVSDMCQNIWNRPCQRQRKDFERNQQRRG